MITIGGHYGGPELEDSKIRSLISAMRSSVVAALGDWELGAAPRVNVVFYVDGSLSEFDIPKIEASRFSRKQRLLLVAVPVPKYVSESGGSVEFVVDALRTANAIAAETFARKKAGEFELARAEAIVDEVERSLREAGFE